jgi:gluconokinase
MAPSEHPGTTSIVVMGVSGSGKSTVAAGLVERLGWEFAEGDDFHPPANWIGEHERAGRSVVVTCSALKRTYRDLLCDGHPSVWFAHVTADAELIRERVQHRTGHYMPASLLDSQLATLEPLDDDEPGARISGAGAPDAVVDSLLATLDAERGLHLGSGKASS